MTALAADLPAPARPAPGLRLALIAAALVALLAVARLWPTLHALMTAHGPAEAEAARFLFWELRLPRVLAGLAAGAAFGTAGALFQAVTRNPLAAPDLLGVTAGAQIGVLLGLTVPALAAFSGPPLLFACGLGAAALALTAAGGWRAPPLRLLLAGGACALLLGAGITIALALFEQNIAGLALWSSGALYQPGAEGLTVAALWLLPPLLTLPFLLRGLEALALGDDAATGIGVAVLPVRFAGVVVATALTAFAVALAGPIGFIGLIAPNLVRAAGIRRFGSLVALSALTGGGLLIAADGAVAGLGLSAGLSTAVATALVGTPILLVLVMRGRALTPPDRGEVAASGRAASLAVVATALLAALIALAACGLAWGETCLPPARWISALAGTDPEAALILGIRGPRIAVAAIAGMMLAASGVVLQSVVRNALAGPELLGVTQGAALTTLCGLLAWPLIGRPETFALALAGGLATLGLILAINRRRRFAPLPVALTGLAFSGLFAALTYAVIVETSAQPARALIWLVGGTYGRAWPDAAALLPWLLVGLPALAFLSRPLDLLTLGDDAAAGLGLDVGLLRALALGLAAVLASAAVAIVGPLAFVGLLTPHLARLVGFHAHGDRLPIAMLLGALLTVVADIVGRAALAPTEIPAGALTALIGAPYFLWLMSRGRKGAR
ncbi:iron ABC transporter permease [Methylobacterium sp. Leaf456]|uniref:iron ABC transporter permease n=1 Tax=Methylobacterium sp. Leaf456 TaxID=1736382 RepID=UPI000A609180|nr:iron ABC transporter permease [Methylobacterium sp. Leaf456]